MPLFELHEEGYVIRNERKRHDHLVLVVDCEKLSSKQISGLGSNEVICAMERRGKIKDPNIQADQVDIVFVNAREFTSDVIRRQQECINKIATYMGQVLEMSHLEKPGVSAKIEEIEIDCENRY